MQQGNSKSNGLLTRQHASSACCMHTELQRNNDMRRQRQSAGQWVQRCMPRSVAGHVSGLVIKRFAASGLPFCGAAARQGVKCTTLCHTSAYVHMCRQVALDESTMHFIMLMLQFPVSTMMPSKKNIIAHYGVVYKSVCVLHPCGYWDIADGNMQSSKMS
jgi:hypothetical protein